MPIRANRFPNTQYRPSAGAPTSSGTKSRRENLHRHVDRPPDAADRRRRIERRADLVVHMRRPQRPQGGQRRPQLRRHRAGRHRPRHAGHADGLQPGMARQLLRRRRLEKQRGAGAGAGQELERVGRAGEIVAVESEQQIGAHGRRSWVTEFIEAALRPLSGLRVLRVASGRSVTGFISTFRISPPTGPAPDTSSPPAPA